jgi:beta-fructofuranosidase
MILFPLFVCLICSGLSRADEGRNLRLGDHVLLYPSDYINDHAVIYDPVDKRWHMYGIQQGQKTFIHLASDELVSSWEKVDDFRLDGREIWAPHIIRHDKKIWMYYTRIGEPREIVLSTCKNLGKGKWKHYRGNPVLARVNNDGSDGKNKDPMVLKVGDQWVMYQSMVKKRENDEDYWCVGYSTSDDLKTWNEARICFDEDKPNDPGVESPFVVKRGEFFYLFLSARPWHGGSHDGGVDVFRSESPYHWNPETDQVQRFSREETGAHAPEIIQDHNGNWYMTRCGHGKGGLWIAPLYWSD